VEHVTKRRWLTAGLIPVVIAFGLGCKRYRGPGSDLINDFGPASMAYIWLFLLLTFFVVPRRAWTWRIVIGVFVFTCAVEFLQLWKPPWLQAVRSTFPGRMVLGTTFSWWDFPAYAVGSLLGLLLLRTICGWSETKTGEPQASTGLQDTDYANGSRSN